MIGIVAGDAAGRRLAAALPDARCFSGPAADALPEAFAACDGIVCFLAADAIVRLIAPLLRGGGADPAIVCADEAGRHAVALLGKSNELAGTVAGILGGEPVITTATTVLDELDGFRIEPGSDLAVVNKAILDGERVALVTDRTWPLPAFPPNVVPAPAPRPPGPAIIVSDRFPGNPPSRSVLLRPESSLTEAGSPRGRLAVIGIGPGARDMITARAVAELRRCSIVVGPDRYIEPIADLLRPGTRTLAGGMGSERERARTAVEQARAGHAVGLIGSGDAGVFATASPALEMCDGSFDVVGVPGVTAAVAAAAVLGAPLGHDHAMISLSDLHTPWDLIARRVRAAAEADLVVCFYNPSSGRRTWQLPRALELLGRQRPPTTPVGWVREATRTGQVHGLSTLAEFDPGVADTRTLVIVGSSRTKNVAGEMVTPREYRWEDK